MKITQATINAFIYDIDGLLLDTEAIYDRVMEHFAGQPIPPAVRKKMFGRKPIESATILATEVGLTITPEEYLDQRKAFFQELFPTAQLMPGAKELIEYGKKNNIPQAAATGSTTEEFRLKTQLYTTLFSGFSYIVTSDQVVHGKPDPEIFLTAAKHLKVKPETCLVFEDAPSGIQAGKAAGMYVIAIPHPLLNKNDVAEADVVLTTLSEFDPAPWGLPPR